MDKKNFLGEGVIWALQETKIGSFGGWIYCAETRQLYPFGGYLNFPKHIGDKVKVLVSSGRIKKIDKQEV